MNRSKNSFQELTSFLFYEPAPRRFLELTFQKFYELFFSRGVFSGLDFFPFLRAETVGIALIMDN